MPTETPMSESKMLAKRRFLQRLSMAKKAKEEWSKDNAQVICEYLIDVHQVQVPEDFADQIMSAHKQFYTGERDIHLSFKLVDVIYVACTMWKDYIYDSKEVFDQLVCEEVLSMERIRTSVIAGRNFAEKQSMPLRERPPYLFTTIVTEHGALKVYS